MLLNAYGRPLTYTAAPAPAPAPTVNTAAASAARPYPGGAYPNTYLVTVNVANPKRGESYARFALYGAPGNTTTVGAYLAAGGRRADIAWDLARGFITVTPAG